MNIVNPDNEDFYNDWRKYEIQNVLNGLYNIKYSKNLMLMPKYYPKRNKNSSAMVFQTSQNMPSFTEKNLSGGADMTHSSSLTDEEYTKYTHDLLQKRLSEFNSSSTSSSQPIPITLNESNIETNTIDFLLGSLEQKISAGIIDNVAYTDLMKIYQYYVNNIYKMEDKYLLVRIINRLEAVGENAEQIIKNKEEDTLSDRNEKNINFAELFLNTLYKLMDFIKENIVFVGRNVAERKIIASSIAREINTMQPKDVLPSVQKQIQEQEKELTPVQEKKPFVPSKMSLEELKNKGVELGLEIYNVDSKNTIKTLLYNYFNPDKPQIPLSKREINRRIKEPSLHTPLSGSGWSPPDERNFEANEERRKKYSGYTGRGYNGGYTGRGVWIKKDNKLRKCIMPTPDERYEKNINIPKLYETLREKCDVIPDKDDKTIPVFNYYVPYDLQGRGLPPIPRHNIYPSYSGYNW